MLTAYYWAESAAAAVLIAARRRARLDLITQLLFILGRARRSVFKLSRRQKQEELGTTLLF